MKVIDRIDPLLDDTTDKVTLTLPGKLLAELKRSAAVDGYGGHRSFSGYASRLLLVALRLRELERVEEEKQLRQQK